MNAKTIAFWGMRAVVAVVFIGMGALPKLQADPISVELFERVGLGPAEAMMYATGLMELIAGVMIVVPMKAVSLSGALLAVGVMGGAIFSHLFTPLGVMPEFTDPATGEAFTMPGFPIAIVLALFSAAIAVENYRACKACKLRQAGEAPAGETAEG